MLHDVSKKPETRWKLSSFWLFFFTPGDTHRKNEKLSDVEIPKQTDSV